LLNRPFLQPSFSDLRVVEQQQRCQDLYTGSLVIQMSWKVGSTERYSILEDTASL
jgi:hypothetical protein